MKTLIITLLFIATFAGCKKERCLTVGDRNSNINRSYVGFDLNYPSGESYFGFFGAGFDFTYTNVFDEKGKQVITGRNRESWRAYNLNDPLQPTSLRKSPLEIDYYNGESAYKDSVGMEINRTFYLKLTKFDTDTIKVKYTLIDACQRMFGRVKVQYNDSTYFDGQVGERICDNDGCGFDFIKK